jgi:hypothetical protein
MARGPWALDEVASLNCFSLTAFALRTAGWVLSCDRLKILNGIVAETATNSGP